MRSSARVEVIGGTVSTHRKLFGHLVANLTVLIAIAGCDGGGGGSDSDESRDPGQLSANCSMRIFQGTTCPSKQGPIAAVIGRDALGRTRTLCSGTFLTKNSVLTAAHCLPAESGENSILKSVVVATGDMSFSAPVTFSPHPRYGEIAENQLNPYDVAILKLPSEIDVATLPILASEDFPLGTPASLYGFGDDETNRSAIERGTPLNQPKRGDVILRAKEGGILLFGASNTGACSGDSGGPAVTISPAGEVGVISIASAVIGSDCTSANISIDDFSQLVGGLAAEIRAQLLAEFPDGMIPRDAYVDLQNQEVLDFIAGEVPEVEIR